MLGCQCHHLLATIQMELNGFASASDWQQGQVFVHWQCAVGRARLCSHRLLCLPFACNKFCNGKGRALSHLLAVVKHILHQRSALHIIYLAPILHREWTMRMKTSIESSLALCFWVHTMLQMDMGNDPLISLAVTSRQKSPPPC